MHRSEGKTNKNAARGGAACPPPAAYSHETLIIKKTILPKQKKKNGESVLGCIYCKFEPCLRKCLILD